MKLLTFSGRTAKEILRDPLNPKVHEPDVNNVVKLCDMYNIPLATNLATAELLVKAMERGDMEWRELYN